MHQTKLIHLLKSFSAWEFKSFQKYVASPFFNVNADVAQLLQLIAGSYPEFNEESIRAEKIFIKLYKNTKFNLQKLRYVMTDLTLLAENFLAYSAYEEKEFYRKKFLLQKLNEKNHDKYFRQHLQQGYQMQQRNREHDIKHYKRQVAFDELSCAFTSAKNNRTMNTQLQNLSDNLDVYYIANKLKYCCEILNRQNILQVTYQAPFLDFIVQYLQKGYLKNIPLIAVYFQLLLMLRHSNTELHYTKLKTIVKKYNADFTVNELRDMYAFIQNYCIRQINSGNLKYLQELFGIYKRMLEQKIIFENNELAHSQFKNITAIALRVNEFDWAENFINIYSSSLNKTLRRNAVHYNLARLYFARKQYRQSLKQLTAVEFTDVYYHLDSKSLLLKIYYETEEFETLFSLINTFRVYLRRSKLISEYQRSVYANLVTQTRRLAKIKSGSKYSLEKIKSTIEANPKIADIVWLKEKIKEFE